MSILKKKQLKQLDEQSQEVKDYFKKICDDDIFNLSIHGFFERVCNSILKNGIAFTSLAYDVDEKILELIS